MDVLRPLSLYAMWSFPLLRLLPTDGSAAVVFKDSGGDGKEGGVEGGGAQFPKFRIIGGQVGFCAKKKRDLGCTFQGDNSPR